MKLEDVYKLVDQETTNYRHNDEYQIPAGKLRSIVELTWLACEAETRSRQPWQMEAVR